MGLSVSKLAGGAAIGVVLFASAPAPAQSITDKLGNWLFGPSSAPADASNPANTVAEVDCPGVTVRQGASTLSITAPGADPGPMTTRYQVSIAQTARECAPLGGVMTMKVGVEGPRAARPRRRAGPDRRAAAHGSGTGRAEPEGDREQVLQDRSRHSAGQTSVPFVHVEQDLTFRRRAPRTSTITSSMSGFDPASLNTKPERPAKKTKKK
jgi:hypothetical protein